LTSEDGEESAFSGVGGAEDDVETTLGGRTDEMTHMRRRLAKTMHVYNKQQLVMA
jgi:hypothetical protein